MHAVLDNILNIPPPARSPQQAFYLDPVQCYFHCYHIYAYIYITSVTNKLPSLDSVMNVDLAALQNTFPSEFLKTLWEGSPSLTITELQATMK